MGRRVSMAGDPLLDLYRDGAFVRRMARGVVGEGAIEDVWQEAWREVLEHPRAGWDLRGYVWTVARRMAGRARRGEGRRAKRERAVARAEALPSEVELLERVEVHCSLVEELKGLEEPYRRTLLLVFFEGLEAAEIARRDGVSIETVRTRKKRALALMRERLRRKHGDQREWLAGLAALAGRRPEELAPLGVSLVPRLVALAALFFGAVGVLWWRSDREADEPEAARGSTVVEVSPDRAPGIPAREPLALAEPADAAAAPVSAPVSAARAPFLLTGRVIDGAGQGLAGAELTASLTGLSSVELLGTARCAADGRYVLSLAGWSPFDVRGRFLALEVFAPGFRCEAREFPLAELGSELAKEWALSAGRTLEGLVLDERGAPVVKAWVAARGTRAGAVVETLATTVAEGRFRLGLEPDFELASLEAWRADIGQAVRAASEFSPVLADLVAVPALVLEPRAVVRGRARYLDGSPARALGLVAFAVEPDGSGGWREREPGSASAGLLRASLFTDGEGRFAFAGLAPGTYAYGPARKPPRVERGLAPEALVHTGEGEVELVLDLRRLVVEVVDARGQPLEDVPVVCTRLAPAEDGSSRPAAVGLRGLTAGPTGSFGFSGLALGRYAVTLELPGFAAEHELELDARRFETVCRLELVAEIPRGALRLVPSSGKPSRFALELSTRVTRAPLGTFVSAVDGLVRVPAGTWHARLRRLEGDPWSLAELPELTVTAGATRTLAFDELRGGHIVLDFGLPEGELPPRSIPSRSTWYSLQNWMQWQSESTQAVLVREDQDEFFVLEGAAPGARWTSRQPLAPGRYRLEARFAGYSVLQRWVEVEAGRTRAVELALARAEPRR